MRWKKIAAEGFNFPKVFHTRLFGGGNRPGARQQVSGLTSGRVGEWVMVGWLAGRLDGYLAGWLGWLGGWVDFLIILLM